MGVVDLVGATASVVSFVMLWPQALRIWSARRDPVILAGASAGTQMLVLVNATPRPPVPPGSWSPARTTSPGSGSRVARSPAQ